MGQNKDSKWSGHLRPEHSNNWENIEPSKTLDFSLISDIKSKDLVDWLVGWLSLICWFEVLNSSTSELSTSDLKPGWVYCCKILKFVLINPWFYTVPTVFSFNT